MRVRTPDSDFKSRVHDALRVVKGGGREKAKKNSFEGSEDHSLKEFENSTCSNQPEKTSERERLSGSAESGGEHTRPPKKPCH